MQRPFRSLADHGLSPTRSGKVREILDLGDRLLIVTTDRISAFDCVLPSLIPGKGRILNRISCHWFRALEPIVPHHLISDRDEEFPRDLAELLPVLQDRWVLVHKAGRIPVECVVRGCLAGSGMREYEEKGTVGGIEMPAGIPPYGRLPEPLFTPTTKEDAGHDQPVTFAELSEQVGEELSVQLRDLSLLIYRVAAEHAAARGLILADTKFEFGWIDGCLTLIDELLTPDSSRYWPVESHRSGPPTPLDKEYVRSYLKTLSWDRNPPAPPLPAAEVEETLRRYQRVHDMLGVGGPPPRLGRKGEGE